MGRCVYPQDWFGKVPRLGLAAERGGTSFKTVSLGTSNLDGSVTAFGKKPRLSVETVLIYVYISLDIYKPSKDVEISAPKSLFLGGSFRGTN